MPVDVLTMKNRPFWEMIKFGIVGLSGIAVGLSVLNIIMTCNRSFITANIIAFLVAATWNFALHRKFTFRHAKQKPLIVQWAMFILSSSLGALANWSVSFTLYYSLVFFKDHYNAAAICGVGVGFLINFAASKLFVFKYANITVKSEG